MPADRELSGVAFVTGGARGLGLATAVAFAQEGARDVVIADVHEQQIFDDAKAKIEAHGAKALCIRADVTVEEDVKGAVQKTVDVFGRLDYAANFAGVGGPVDLVWDTPVDKWKQVVDVNLTGVFASTKYQMIQMLKQEPLSVENHPVPQRGAIVNCASITSILSTACAAGYCATKHGVVGLSKTAALEGRKHHVRVNSISPGFILTSLPAQALADPLNPHGEKAKAVWAGFEARQGRKAYEAEIGRAVTSLCNPKLSLVNGHNLVCDNCFAINALDS